MNNIDITVHEIKKELKTENIEKICNNILKLLQIESWEISLVICGDDFIKNLNREYRDRDEATDVLSFPQIEGESVPESEEFYAGDIVISIDSVEKNSSYFNVDINEEFSRLLIHGILHLKGMVHETNDEDQEMIKYQEVILKKITGVKVF